VACCRAGRWQDVSIVSYRIFGHIDFKLQTKPWLVGCCVIYKLFESLAPLLFDPIELESVRTTDTKTMSLFLIAKVSERFNPGLKELWRYLAFELLNASHPLLKHA
jgi:hypothetical protein